jgi:hypothetical protein
MGAMSECNYIQNIEKEQYGTLVLRHYVGGDIERKIIRKLVIDGVNVLEMLNSLDFETVKRLHDYSVPKHYIVEKARIDLPSAIVEIEKEHYAYKADSYDAITFNIIPKAKTIVEVERKVEVFEPYEHTFRRKWVCKHEKITLIP